MKNVEGKQIKAMSVKDIKTEIKNGTSIDDIFDMICSVIWHKERPAEYIKEFIEKLDKKFDDLIVTITGGNIITNDSKDVGDSLAIFKNGEKEYNKIWYVSLVKQFHTIYSPIKDAMPTYKKIRDLVDYCNSKKTIEEW